MIAALLLAASSSSALAVCPNDPDNAATAYSDNSIAHALCLQRELEARIRLEAEEARMKMQIDMLQSEIDRRRRQLMFDYFERQTWPLPAI